MASKSKLTPKQEAFARAYIETGNASEAYRRTYNASKMKPATVNVKASELLAHGKITARLDELRAGHQKRHEVTVDRIIGELAKIGFSDLRKAVKWGPYRKEETAEDGTTVVTVGNDVTLIPSEQLDDATAACIGEVSQGQHGVRIKLHDKRAALVDMGKHLGMFVEKHEHTGKDGKPIQTEDVTERAPDDFGRRVALLLTGAVKSNGYASPN